MKRLLWSAIVAGLALLAFKAWESPYYALRQIDAGLDARDAVAVERYVDLESMVVALASAAGAMASEGIGAASGDLGSRVVGALVDAVARGVGDVVRTEGAMELRRAIQEGRLPRAVGPFALKEGLAAFGPAQTFQEDTALVELKGTCRGRDASLLLRFSRRNGPVFGRPYRYVLTGFDEPSVKALVKQCA